MRQNCNHTKADGSPCRAVALAGKDTCAFHDPELAAARAEGRRRGGVVRNQRAAVVPAAAAELPLGNAGEIIAALALTVNQVRKGSLDVRIGNAVGYLAGILLNALRDAELERRVAELEERVAKSGRHGQ